MATVDETEQHIQNLLASSWHGGSDFQGKARLAAAASAGEGDET